MVNKSTTWVSWTEWAQKDQGKADSGADTDNHTGGGPGR